MLKSLIIVNILIFGVLSQNNNQTQPAVQAKRDTTPCSGGYYWTTQSCMPCLKFFAIPNSAVCICTVPGTCTSLTCVTGYAPNNANNSCVQVTIPSGCLTYQTGADAIICLTCDSLSTLIGGLCIPTLSCSSFNLTTGVCTTCVDGSYLNYQFLISQKLNNNGYQSQFASQCSLCMTNCKQCASGDTCINCNSGYFWQTSTLTVPGLCTSCANGCASCSGSQTQNCTQCATNYFPDNTTKACSTCQINGCQSCESTTTCGTCQTNFNRSSDKTSCQAIVQVVCSPGCQSTSCSSNSTCTACLPGFVLISNACTQCNPGCQSCAQLGNSTQTTCVTCQDTFSLTKGQSDSNANTCTSCSSSNPSWLRCNGPFDPTPLTPLAPTECIDQYFLYGVGSNSTCVAYQTSNTNTCLLIQNGNSNDCLTCLIAGQQKLTQTYCQSCPTGCNTCGATGNLTICTQCTSNYYSTQDKPQCTECGNGCSTCSATSCTTCYNGYYLNGNVCSACSTQGCTTCPSNVCSTCGFFQFLYTNSNNALVCNSCPDGCVACSSTGALCTTCLSGYVLQNGGCVPITYANCQTSSVTQGCLICQYGFYLKNSRCFECVNPQSSFVCRTNAVAPVNSSSTGTNPTNSTSSKSNSYYLAAPVLALFLIILQ